MGLLDGKVAVITGSTSGMGKASARVFAKEGAKVIVVGRGHEASLERGKKIVEEILNDGGKAVLISADATKEEDVLQLIEKTIKFHGKIDVLYNVAGGGRSKPLDQDTTEDWEQTLAVNLKSAFLTSKYAMPYLVESKGAIINTSSVAAIKPVLANQYSYSAANAGVIMFSKTLARDYAAKGVRVNVIAPGVIDTPIWEQAPKAWFNELVNKLPIQRVGKPEEIAGVALFLASDLASYVTGQVICVDGGQSIG
ncbi:MAG: 3-oxoacyl-ACP reductase [Firmicutes bacterium HGW-Firmicutes-12]|nr:MAG: 3-oxoacyl-ACP reductase [Firmicutes bacterium HGW-Firmicutes-12]